jgi:hypothetical protein
MPQHNSTEGMIPPFHRALCDWSTAALPFVSDGGGTRQDFGATPVGLLVILPCYIGPLPISCPGVEVAQLGDELADVLTGSATSFFVLEMGI